MSTPYIGEIRPWAATFAPVGWLYCDGSSQSIAQYQTLFSLIGTTYGGDGQTTFNLPDLRARVPLHASATLPQGAVGGSAEVTLQSSQLPTHTHALATTAKPGTTSKPAAAFLADLGPGPPTNVFSYIPPTTSNLVNLAPSQITTVGNSIPHNNLQPYQAISFIIAYDGIYPPQP